jgi:hypothetical protein
VAQTLNWASVGGSPLAARRPPLTARRLPVASRRQVEVVVLVVGAMKGQRADVPRL